MIDDTDLIERTKIALETVSDCPWLPDLTGDLVKMGWRNLYQETGISPSNYGTSRVIAKSVHAPRNVVSYLSNSWAIELLNENLADNYKDAGIEFYTATEIQDANLLISLEDAINLIKQIPTLHATVGALVRSIHLIKPEDDDYDVSFSEPHIPFSIFVSVSQHQSSPTALRIAEAVVHEAMHLQLTLVEQSVPLTISTSQQYYSPWREEYRTAQGVLHALYVFRVIDRFLEPLSCIKIYQKDVAKYARNRRDQISMQIHKVQSFGDCSSLTPAGACFIQRVLQD